MRAVAFAASVLAFALLTGCANDPLADEYRNGTENNYISGAGVYKEYAEDDRGEPVEFTGVTDAGESVSSEDFSGTVLVVNFWYAGCPPCRVEAPDLEALHQEYGEAEFLGVNTYDQPANSLAFARKFGVTYPSVIDANDAAVQLAFAGSVPPNAVPTTLVLDRTGRVAARWTGGISEPSILSAMIDRVLAEEV